MATTTIAWGDGTGDNITVTYDGGSGTTTATVSSDPNNTASQRSKTITFKSADGTQTETLAVTQEFTPPVVVGDFNNDFNNDFYI